MVWQRFADQVQIGGVCDEHSHTVLIGGFKVLGASLNGGQLSVCTLLGRFSLNHAHVVKIP